MLVTLMNLFLGSMLVYCCTVPMWPDMPRMNGNYHLTVRYNMQLAALSMSLWSMLQRETDAERESGADAARRRTARHRARPSLSDAIAKARDPNELARRVSTYDRMLALH